MRCQFWPAFVSTKDPSSFVVGSSASESIVVYQSQYIHAMRDADIFF